MKKVRGLISAILVVCVLFSFTLTASAAGKGYSDIQKIYVLEGVNGKPGLNTVGIMCGDSNAPDSNYVEILTMAKSGQIFVDVVSKAEFDKMSQSALTTQSMNIKNYNEYMLSLGADDEYLIIDDKPSAVADVEKAIAAGKTTVTIRDYVFVTPDLLKFAADNGITKINFDSIYNKTVEGRISLNPATATKGFGGLSNGGFWEEDPAVKMINKFYSNTKFSTVSTIQTGNFGTTVELVVQVDGIEKLDTSKLVFSCYNGLTNKMVPIANPNYSIDDKGYLHFYTSVGGTIIVTDSALVKK